MQVVSGRRGGEALRRNVDVRRVNARGSMINVYEVQIVPIGTIRIEVVVEEGGEGNHQTSRIHRLRDSGTSSTLNPRFSAFSLAFPVELVLVTSIICRSAG
jgi:hypothetical protein